MSTTEEQLRLSLQKKLLVGLAERREAALGYPHLSSFDIRGLMDPWRGITDPRATVQETSRCFGVLEETLLSKEAPEWTGTIPQEAAQLLLRTTDEPTQAFDPNDLKLDTNSNPNPNPNPNPNLNPNPNPNPNSNVT